MKNGFSGSKWLKADLHVHTPASFHHEYGDGKSQVIWERFISELEALPAEFKILGINDYVTIDGYIRLLHERQNNGRLKNIELLLPVIEFRIKAFVGEEKTKRINYHVIFSDEITPDVIKSQFIAGLAQDYCIEPGSPKVTWSAIPDNASLLELGEQLKSQAKNHPSVTSRPSLRLGFDNFNVSLEVVAAILRRPQFEGKVLTAIGKNEWSAFRWDGAASDKRSIINNADVIFTASRTISDYEEGKRLLTAQQVNDRLLHCSDAHYFSDSKENNKIGNCFTWLKIEPTFEGLRQILFEPDARISISETHPDKKAPYQVIESVRFVGGGRDFPEDSIELSPYLNAIIGGKSTGKSLLANLIVKSSDNLEYSRRGRKKEGGGVIDPLEWLNIKYPAMNFEVRWKDGKTTSTRAETNRKITYFPQHYLNKNINDDGSGAKELNKIIRNVLAQNKDYTNAFNLYRDNLQNLDAEVAATATKFENTLRETRETRHKLGERGNSKDIKNNIDRLEAELSELKIKFAIPEDDVELHALETSKIKAARLRKLELSQEVQILEEATLEHLTKNLTIESILPSLGSLPDLREELAEIAQPLVKEFAEKLSASLKAVKSSKQDEIETLLKEMQSSLELINPISMKISQSLPLSEMTSLLNSESEKLVSALSLEKDLASLITSVEEDEAKLLGFIEKRLEYASHVMAILSNYPLPKGEHNLEINITPRFKSEHIRTLLRDRLKYQSNPTMKAFIQNEDVSDTDLDVYRNRVAAVVSQAIENKIEFKSEYTLSGVLQELLTSSTFLNYDLKLGKDSFTAMSPGKRALALLRIIIELDSSEHPIVLDQPEDDLDNRSIYEGLATYLKAKKLKRQIIVVTHNPNVVVGADSEFVIVANQTGQETDRDNRDFTFEYRYGGLENSFRLSDNPYVLEKQGIKEHVCDILDGGEAAFERRELLYGTVKH